MQEQEGFPADPLSAVPQDSVCVLAGLAGVADSILTGEGEHSELPKECHVQLLSSEFPALAPEVEVVVNGEQSTAGFSTLETATTSLRHKGVDALSLCYLKRLRIGGGGSDISCVTQKWFICSKYCFKFNIESLLTSQAHPADFVQKRESQGEL